MAAKGSEVVDVEVSILAETEKAWKVQSWSTDKLAWVPKSLAEYEANDSPGMSYEAAILTIPTWLAQEKELI